MIEEWKDILHFEGLYQISNLGRVFSYISNRIIKSSLHQSGYYIIKIVKDKKRFNYRINRLVAIHFIENPENLPFVNHKDEVRSNDIYTNLEWCTRQYNNTYGDRIAKQSKTLTETWKRRKKEQLLINQLNYENTKQHL